MVEQTDNGAAEEAHYKLLRLLEQEPELTQRDIAERLGISLGKANYCVRALVSRGWVKAGNFYRSDNKRAYLYILTPKGIAQKAKIAMRFLRRKEAEHEAILNEIKVLREDIALDGNKIANNRSNS